MTRSWIALLGAAAVLGIVAAAPAAAQPRMTAAERRAIGSALDAFVKGAVLRRNLAAAWKLAGPDLRGGTTRRAWIEGTGVTVQYFPARGEDFRRAWTGSLVEPGHAQLSVVLHPKPGSGYDETAAAVDMRLLRGRWVVDRFYTAAVFRSGKGHSGSCGTADCAVSGSNDFKAGAGAAYGNGPSRIGGHWLLVGLATAGSAIVLAGLGIWIRLRLRSRRFLAEYERAHG